ncbi:MAG: flagellar filament capping protein FliD [Desulfonauticus sp.]|nr:flagellar filament capping protein FliD [Desulfonauticus sp.]
MADVSDLTNDYLISGQIHFTGLGSGTDFDSVIQKLVELEKQQHVKPLQDQQKKYEDQISAIQDLNTAMLNLQSTVESMDTIKEFFIKNATSTDTSVLTATASSEAAEGTHTIVINQLAQNDVLISKNYFSSEDSSINDTGADETFSYTYNGNTVSLTIPDGTTLSSFVSMINNDPNNPGVKATIIKKADGQYYFQFSGLDLGSDYAITINEGPSSFDADSSGTVDNSDFSNTQVAQNAQIQVDGFPDDGTWIERNTNTIDDVITGVTLNLKNTGTVQVTISNDIDAIKENIHNFVDQVNKVFDLIKEQTKITSTAAGTQGSVLTGNYGVQIVQQRLKSLLARAGIGFDRDLDPYPSLSNIGITTDADQGSPTFGELKIDEAKLDEALQTNPQAVAEIFSADYVPVTSSNDFKYYSLIQGVTKAGEYDVEYEVSGGTIVSATIDGQSASVDGNIITSLEGDSKGLAIQVDNLTDGTYTGTIRLKYGKVLELRDELDKLTDSYDGTLHIIEDNYNDIVKDLDKKISWEEDRIAQYERTLRDRFARLETVLGYYNSLNTQLTSQIASLQGNSK